MVEHRKSMVLLEDRVARVMRLLEELGPRAAEVAATLKAGGFTGRRGLSHQCPISRYLAAGGVESAAVYPSISEDPENSGQTAHVDLGDEQVPLPEAVDLFVEAFDRGHYPALVSP